MLLANTSNRNIIARTVASYAEAMLRGEWNPHSTITFAEDGTLLDGQHRAAAVVKSGVPIQAIVVRGAAMEAQETIDTGSRRTFGALLAIRGVKNAHNVAGAVKILWRIETGNMRAHGTATNRQLLDVMDRHPGVADHASFPGQKNLGAIGVGMGEVPSARPPRTAQPLQAEEDGPRARLDGANLSEHGGARWWPRTYGGRSRWRS